MLLRRAGVEHRLTFEAPRLPRCRVPVEGGPEPVELPLEPGLDLAGPLRQLVEHDVGHAVDLGDPVGRRTPPDAEALCQLAPQRRVVQRGERPLVALDQSGVQRQPASIRDANLGDDDRVGVQLRIERPAGVLPEKRDREPVGVDVLHRSVDRGSGSGVALDEVDDRLDGGSWAASDSPATRSSPSAHNVDTDFGAENVMS